MPQGLNSQDIQILNSYKEAGNRDRYWSYLAAKGDAYAALALHVVRNDNNDGKIANLFAAQRASELGVPFDEQKWNAVGVELMKLDFGKRSRALEAGAPDGGLTLSFDTIEQYHAKVFQQFSLDTKAWTPEIPLQEALKFAGTADAQALWNDMLATGFSGVGGFFDRDRSGAAAAEIMKVRAQRIG